MGLKDSQQLQHKHGSEAMPGNQYNRVTPLATQNSRSLYTEITSLSYMRTQLGILLQQRRAGLRAGRQISVPAGPRLAIVRLRRAEGAARQEKPPRPPPAAAL